MLLTFPYVEQVFQIERTRESLYGEILSEEIAYGITSITKDKSTAELLMEISRGHWTIENCCNYVKDVTFREDFCRVKTKNSSQFFSSIRNIAINLYRRLGFNNIAKAQRYFINGDKANVMRLAGISV